MDAFVIYAKYINGQALDTNDKKIDYTDPNIFELVRLMHQHTETTQEPETKQDEETDTVESVARPTKQTETETKTEDRKTDEITPFNAIPLVDQAMAQRSRQRINAFLQAIKHNVSMDWVHAWASRILPEPSQQIKDQYETYQPESNRHIHIVKNDVRIFICALRDAMPGQTTTFAWSHTSKKAIHLQKLKKQLKKMFQDVEPAIAMMVAGSIGLPLHELIKPCTFVQKMKKYRFKTMTTDSIIKITLRDQVTIEKNNPKNNPKIESRQLLEAYAQKETLFGDFEKYTDVSMFFFKHWYSYPTAFELEHLLERALQNLNLWCPF